MSQKKMQILEPPEKVWEALVNFTDWPAWLSGVTGVSEMPVGPEIGPSLLLKPKRGSGTICYEITKYEAPRELALRRRFGQGASWLGTACETDLSWRIDPDGEGTLITFKSTWRDSNKFMRLPMTSTIEMTAHEPGRWLEPFVRHLRERAEEPPAATQIVNDNASQEEKAMADWGDDFVDGAITGALLLGRGRRAGPPGHEFPFVYRSGHPIFPRPDSKWASHNLIVTDDALVYTRGSRRDVTFAVKREAIVRVTVKGSSLSVLLKSGVELSFEATGLKEGADIRRAVELLTPEPPPATDEGVQTAESRASAERPTSGGDPLRQIERLAALHSAGVLTDDEFAAKKAELLSRL